MDRLRAEERLDERQGRTVVTSMALAPDGSTAGHTILAAGPGGHAFQDTLVLPSHRGHGLGIVLKAVNLLRLQRDAPSTVAVETTNATQNTPMRAINDRLGFTALERCEDWQRDAPIPQPATPKEAEMARPHSSEEPSPPATAVTTSEVLAWWAERFPDRIAHTVIAPDGTESDITYGAWHRASLAVAAGLARQGVTAGSHVGLAFTRGQTQDFAASLVATHRLGAAAVLLPADDDTAARHTIEALTPLQCLVATEHEAPSGRRWPPGLPCWTPATCAPAPGPTRPPPHQKARRPRSWSSPREPPAPPKA
ncbi:AMP-binding protein [Streptomyces zhihengii]